jgi:hypothetical protein
VGSEQVLESSDISADLCRRWLAVVLAIPFLNFIIDDGCPGRYQLTSHVFYCQTSCSSVARCENHTTVLAHTVICNEGEVAEGFFTISNALHPRGYVYNAEVEVNLYTVNVVLAV